MKRSHGSHGQMQAAAGAPVLLGAGRSLQQLHDGPPPCFLPEDEGTSQLETTQASSGTCESNEPVNHVLFQSFHRRARHVSNARVEAQ